MISDMTKLSRAGSSSGIVGGLFCGEVREGFPEKVTSEQRPEEGKVWLRGTRVAGQRPWEGSVLGVFRCGRGEEEVGGVRGGAGQK